MCGWRIRGVVPVVCGLFPLFVGLGLVVHGLVGVGYGIPLVLVGGCSVWMAYRVLG